MYNRISCPKIKQKIKESDPFLYEPENFRPEKYGGKIAAHPDAARWLLSTLYTRRLLRNYDRGSYINLHSELLALVMGDRNYVAAIRKELLQHGLIECDGEWVKNKKSLGYRIGPALDGVKWRKYHSPDKRFAKRVTMFKQHLLGDGLVIPVRQHLADWVRKVDFSDQLDDVLNSLPTTPYQNCDHENKREYARHQVEIVRSGFWSITQSCPYGRFHSNITSLCGELRRCLTLDGEKLYEVDIVNSQPFFLSMILFELSLGGDCQGVGTSHLSHRLLSSYEDHSLLFPSFHHASNHSNQEEEDDDDDTNTKGTRTPPYVSGLSPYWGNLGKIDIQAMVEATSNGTFYETIQAKTDNWTREEVKRKVFQVIFGDVRLMQQTEIGQAFQMAYPTAFDLMVKMKKTKGYEFIGHELQRRESSIVINTVCERLRAHYIDLPILTVHDSILTTREHLETVRGLLEAAFNQYPTRPRLKIKEPL
jgi:hypothetical protein